jgi:hypothetical protein
VLVWAVWPFESFEGRREAEEMRGQTPLLLLPLLIQLQNLYSPKKEKKIIIIYFVG